MKEIVTGYRCEKCKDTKDKRRIHQVTHSPDVLLIQLKRFDWSGRKDPVAIPFKADLDLNRYRADANKDNSKYELSAVVMHRGSSGSGHYRCLAKGDDDCWNDFDDAHVSRVKSTTVLDPGKGSGSAWTPYLLFFQRQRK
jgi:ubiquitin C-terminal hydrolase